MSKLLHNASFLFFLFVLLSGNGLYGQTNNSQLREVTVLYTNDEHGWMEGMQPGQGAANLYQLWRNREGLTKDGPFLVLSGGDNFTGPAISTWVQGESMVDVLNAMHYDASAVGNHEFDFGLEALKQRTEQADYPYLSANIKWQDSMQSPSELGILPYTIKQVNDLNIAVIGLTTTSTPFVANPVNVQDLVFSNYETALRDTVEEIAQIENEAPDLTFIISHVCMEELDPLVSRITDLNIALIGAGHCNELVAKKTGETVMLGGGFHFTAYARATFTYDMQNQQIVSSNYTTARNRGSEAANDIDRVITRWADSANDTLNEVIAYSAMRIERSNDLPQLIIDSWLEAYPAADIAITNIGGIRADLPAGEITLADLVTVLPFDNTIISVEVSGQVVATALDSRRVPVVAGLMKRNGKWVFVDNGATLNAETLYTVLVNSFNYAGGDNLGIFAEADPEGFDTGVHYRHPFYDWLKNQESAQDNPLRF